jgi:uncharacterized membrane protein YkoI
MKTVMLAFIVTTLFTSMLSPAWALFETNKELSDKARVSLIQAIRAAERRVMPGKPVEVTLGKDGGKVVYKVEILDANKKTHTVHVDAENGQVLKVN